MGWVERGWKGDRGEGRVSQSWTLLIQRETNRRDLLECQAGQGQRSQSTSWNIISADSCLCFKLYDQCWCRLTKNIPLHSTTNLM